MTMHLEVYWNIDKDEPASGLSEHTRVVELFSVGVIYESRGIPVVWSGGCKLYAVKNISEISNLIKRTR